MKEGPSLKKLKYDVSLTPKSGFSYLEGSIGKISRLDFKRGLSFFEFKILYENNEYYNLKYNFKDKHYVKSYFFKERDKIIDKKEIYISKKDDIEKLNLFIAEHFRRIIDNKYIIEEGSSINLENLNNDLRNILRVIF